MSKFFDPEGEPMTLEEWMEAFESDKRLLRQEWVLKRDGKRYWISTVWLGIDHNFFRGIHEHMLAVMDDDGVLQALDTRPWIYETMAFKNEPGFTDIFARSGGEVAQERDATREEALATHERIKEEL